MSASIAALPPAIPDTSGGLSSFANDFGLADISFHDILSVVNPFQHLPIVATVYRAITGDTIRPLERIAGDALYGGLWGFVSSVANVAFQEITGKDFGDTALAFLEGDNGTEFAANSASGATDHSAPASAVAAASVASLSAAPTVASVVVAPAAPVEANAPPKSLQAPRGQAQDSASLALLSVMNSKGIDPTLSQRAFQAYSKSLAASPAETVPIF